jgi:hypothetical protein
MTEDRLLTADEMRVHARHDLRRLLSRLAEDLANIVKISETTGP